MNLTQENSLSKYPPTERILYKREFGAVDSTRGNDTMNPPITLDDNYNWLRDDTRKDTKVLEHLKRENDFTEKVMNDMDANSLKDTMYQELLSHVQETYDSYPLPNSDNGWGSSYYYFTRTVEGKSYPIHCRVDKMTNTVQELLDENIIADGKTCCDISNFCVTKDHKYMSYGIDLTGNEKYDLKIINIETGKEVVHDIPELTYCDYSWINIGTNQYIYYTLGDMTNRMYQLWKYDFNTKENSMLYQNMDELVNVNYYFSHDKKYTFICADSYETSDVYYMTNDMSQPTQFTSKIPKHKYTVDYHEGVFLIKTNKDESTNFKIMICNPDNTDISKWIDFIEYREEIYFKNIVELKNHLLICYKKDGHNLVRVIDYKNSAYDLLNSYDIEIEDSIKNIGIYATPQYDSNIIMFSQNSLKSPPSIYEMNLDSRKFILKRKKPVPNYNEDLYDTERQYAVSQDGTKVPISIVYRKDKFTMDGTNPLYLYGYGSYGATINPTFRTSVLPLLDRGFVFAIAHVRGSSFLGFKWYMDGKMETKINTFHDFNACAEHLIREKYTFSKGITIEGGSAGGLLVGAAMTMRPELYRTVIADVPFVDVMNTMCDPSIPLTIPEWEQWGNPNVKKFYDIMIKYSPYDNINKTSYPNLLALGGLNDPRVAYWEPAKFVAKMRHYNVGNSLILLKTEMEQGHFGGMDRYKHYMETAFNYAFMLKTY